MVFNGCNILEAENAVEAKFDLERGYDSFFSFNNISKRFHQMSRNLGEEELMGLQIMADENGEIRDVFYSGKDVEITSGEYEWILSNKYKVVSSDNKLLDAFTAKGRFLYVISEDSEDPYASILEDEQAIEFITSLINSGGGIRFVATSGGEMGKGLVVLSLTEKMSLTMKTLLSFCFPTSKVSLIDENLDPNCLYPVYFDTFQTRMARFLYLTLDLRSGKNLDKINSKDMKNEWEPEEFQDGYSFIPDTETPIEELELDVRGYNCLKRAGIDTIEELMYLSDEDIKHIRNMGRKCAERIRKALEDYKKKNLKEVETDEEIDYGKALEELIGLENVKRYVDKVIASARLKKDLKEKTGNEPSIVLNMAFVGNPGTAKTTVARMIAGILYQYGIVKSRKLIEVGRADLVGKYVGHTAAKVEEIFEKARGKVLFIDEAYSLVESGRDDFGDEAINTIVQEMENNREHTVVIFAGYPDEMEELLTSNPGLKSRVPFKLTFNDYSVDEMVEIVKFDVAKRSFKISDDGLDAVRTLCEEAKDDKESGNGRFCRNLVDNALLNYAERLYGKGCDGEGSDFVLRAEDFTELSNKKEKSSRVAIGFCA